MVQNFILGAFGHGGKAANAHNLMLSPGKARPQDFEPSAGVDGD